MNYQILKKYCKKLILTVLKRVYLGDIIIIAEISKGVTGMSNCKYIVLFIPYNSTNPLNLISNSLVNLHKQFNFFYNQFFPQCHC